MDQREAVRVAAETLPFLCASTAILPKTDVFGCGAAAGRRKTLPFLALPLPFCQRLMPVPMLAVLQEGSEEEEESEEEDD